ncbi:MAG: hypothetical protein WDW36_005135 [Sanguina aurantia]
MSGLALSSMAPTAIPSGKSFTKQSLEADYIQAVKLKLQKEWVPEYEPQELRPPQDSPDVHSERATNVTLRMILSNGEELSRKTKIICTAGPACWSEAGLAAILDAGCNVLRFNFSHGDHDGHKAVLDRYRKVCTAKGLHAASLLDTKGPEIRTAMLRDHQSIALEAGQTIFIEAVGDAYTSFEGYKTDAETRIGLSYAKLCDSVSPGNKILIADGSISITVDEVLSGTLLRGTVLNSKALGERKNCNLPGVKVDIPVLTGKDIADLQSFGAAYRVDFVAASFVQSAADVRFIRQTLDAAGGERVKIISKIENLEGLVNYDEILRESDGIMVARGDLGMEIPSEKVPVAQKMMITKANIAGKFVICATQMLESMIDSPRPTRAEMTDVANAVYDGVDCVMLSGETANGKFSDTAVATMAAIVANAEVGVDYYSQVNFIRHWATNGNSLVMSAAESMLSSAALLSVGFTEDTTPEVLLHAPRSFASGSLIVVLTADGTSANLVAKYRPPSLVVVAATDLTVLRQSAVAFGQVPLKLDSLEIDTDVLADMAVAELRSRLLLPLGRDVRVVVARGTASGSADNDPVISVVKVGGHSLKRKGWSTGNVLYTPSGVPIQRPGIRSLRSSLTNLPLITAPVKSHRSTKVVCTIGPSCWSEEALGALLDSGMDVIRLNFSHGDHAGHLAVLQRFRKVCGEKQASIRERLGVSCAPGWASLLDTKGPEIRTAMLRDHQSIALEAGQTIFIEAVGDAYTSFEGYKTDAETRIGLSYAKLCSSVSPGNKILIADGSISITVDEVLSGTLLRGTVLNSKALGERKNCNLPGVKVDIPVLTGKDIADLQGFCAQYQMDYVAASFVQSADDVRFIRQVLDSAPCGGGERVKIISKIENAEGLVNYDEILRESDGIMVARGDLGMEIASEKVPLAQKMMITKANIAGKFVITATQMLESMVSNPRPTRAEMTDVANAVLDGTDAVMLSGETANGAFPALAVQTMAAICQNAECMVEVNKRYEFLRNHTPKPMSGAESVCSGAVQTAIDTGAKAIICVTTSGRAPGLVSKFKPGVPVFVVTPDAQLVRHCRSMFGQIGVLVRDLDGSLRDIVEATLDYGKKLGVLEVSDGDELVILQRRKQLPGAASLDDQRLVMRTLRMGGSAAPERGPLHTAYPGSKVLFHRSTKIGLDTILDPERFKFIVRKTKIICTAGPACWSEAGLAALLDAGCNVLRFNFSHGDHDGHKAVLDRYRKVCTAKGLHAASLLDTKGPEIRTAMLRDHRSIALEAGQTIFIEAVGDAYTRFEGYKTDAETRIGLSYAKLCDSVSPGNKILIADGSISITVDEVLSGTLLRGTVLNSKALGERKNCNLPGVKVDIPVLTGKDIADLQGFCATYRMDFVAASFVQSADDVRFIRQKLDEAGGQDVRIISKIENAEGLLNFDEILWETDGVMVARGDLGMEIPVEKVPLAQKMMITKANIAGKFVICATQMMESMISNPMPTRAEMTDVANAVFDGVDAVMLSGETANGAYPGLTVETMAKICRSAEIGVNFYQSYQYIRSFTPKPVCAIEAIVSSVAKAAVDIRPGMIVVFSEGGKVARLLAKYRPCAPVLVVTSNPKLARYCSALFAMHTMLLGQPIASLREMPARVQGAMEYGVAAGLCVAGKEVVVLTSSMVARGADDVVDSSHTLPEREVFVALAPGKLAINELGALALHSRAEDPKSYAKTISMRSTVIDFAMIMSSAAPVRKTKVCVTLGPSCSDEATLSRLVAGGMNVARLNLSHSSYQWHEGVLALLRKVAAQHGRSVAVMLDLTGPELRTSYLVDSATKQRVKSIEVEAGDVVTLYGEDGTNPDSFVGYKSGNRIRLGVSLPDLAYAVKVGTVARLMDGTIGIEIRSLESDGTATGVVLNSGTIGERKVLTLVGVTLHLPCMSVQDLKDLSEFGIRNRIDFVCVSQVRNGADVLDVRAYLDDNGGEDVRIISKIETAEGLRQVDDIIDASDGVLLARGNLGVVIGPEKVALAQALVTTKSNIAGKPVMIARQMLESMVSNPRPTRAEMTDVANAVLDGAHCIVLSSETALGAFPVESLSTACDIVRNAEHAVNYVATGAFIRDFSAKPFHTVEAAALALAHACTDARLGLCVVVSDSGEAANLVSKYKPPRPPTGHQLAAARHPALRAHVRTGVRAPAPLNTTHTVHRDGGGASIGYLVDQDQIHTPRPGSIEKLLEAAIAWAVSKGFVSEHQRIAVMHGSGRSADTNSAAMFRIIEPSSNPRASLLWPTASPRML